MEPRTAKPAGEAGLARVSLMGSTYMLTVLTAKPRRVRSKGREYWQYTIHVPSSLARWLLREAGEEPGTPLPLTTLITPSPWHHLIDWRNPESERILRRAPGRVRREVEALGLRDGGPVVLIPARPEELRELGLDPEKPLTLKDIVRAVEERLASAAARE